MTAKLLNTYDCEDCTLELIASDDGSLLLFADGSDVLKLVDSRTNEVVKSAPKRGMIFQILRIPDSSTVLMGFKSEPYGFPANFDFWDWRSGNRTQLPGTRSRVGMLPVGCLDADSLITRAHDPVGDDSDELFNIKLSTGFTQLLYRTKTKTSIQNVTIASSKKLAAWVEASSESGDDEAVVISGSSDLKPHKRLPLHGTTTIDLQFAPGSRDLLVHFITQAAGSKIIVYSGSDGHVVTQFPAIYESGEGGGMAVSNSVVAVWNAKRLYSRDVRVYDITSGRLLGSFSLRADTSKPQFSLQFTPDSANLIFE